MGVSSGMFMRQKVLVVGAGWYGCHIAYSLQARGFTVKIVDRADDFFAGASRFNQNRLHQGFHYPRCKRTRLQSQRGYHLFRKHYDSFVMDLQYNLYAVAKDSSIDFETYKDIMSSSRLAFEDVSEVSPFYLKNVSGIVDCEEAVILPSVAKDFFTEKLSNIVQLGVEVTESDIENLKQEYDFVVDCSWGGVVPSSHQYFEACLYFSARTDKFQNIGLTLMDGGYFSIYPSDRDNHTVTHVTHSPLKCFDTQRGAYSYLESIDPAGDFVSKLKEAIVKDISKYYPAFTEDFSIDKPMFSVKTKMQSGTDSRFASITRSGNVLQVHSGKIDTIFDAESLVIREMLRV